MAYQESLDYLYGLQKFGIKLGLENIRALLDRLGHPERAYGVIHVAGSNGKGSVCACLDRILREAGLRVGLYTSPHLHSFTERIRVNGVPIEETRVAAYTEELRTVAGEIPSTFFEFTTAMALLHFQRERVDFAVLETGMGGRLDATNAVESPRVTVITSICRDHAGYLGGDLSTIAGEKGGIIKPGVPLVLGRQAAEADRVLRTLAWERQAPIRDYGSVLGPDGDDAPLSWHGRHWVLEGLHSGLLGGHQRENLSLALGAAEILAEQGEPLTPTVARAGIAKARWPGRLEWWGGARRILLDGAHNEGGAAVLAGYLRHLAPRAVRWVVGLKGDKEAAAILSPLLPWVAELYCTVPPVEEAVPPEVLAQLGREAGRSARIFTCCAEALAAALKEQRPGEIVLVAGSLFLVAAARESLAGDGPMGDPLL
ncbi:MAG: folylpolyglutamate synthase/dihydrofolate synthase family protein [Trichloromonas sp.]|nr:folylpolyglutamate synthase/dihydrofolate synthase family protein [Trichloromonas sp.]